MYIPSNTHTHTHTHTTHTHTHTHTQELERGLEASAKTHAQEVKGLRLRNRALATETEALRDSTTKLHSQLKVSIEPLIAHYTASVVMLILMEPP